MIVVHIPIEGNQITYSVTSATLPNKTARQHLQDLQEKGIDLRIWIPYIVRSND